MGKNKTKKPFYKKWTFWVIAFILIGIIGSALETEEEKTDQETKQEVRKQENEEKKLAKEKDKEEQDTNVDKEAEEKATENEANEGYEDKEEEITWDDLKNNDKIVGKSNKNFKEITKSKPSKVRNDVTGNWRVITISESVDIIDYAKSYHDLHMSEDEVHFIVNFSLNTTTWLNEMGGLLYVDIRERVDKEEHDGKKLGSGMVLKSYKIYPDGDIEELPVE